MSADLSSLTPVADHLWQSAVFAGVIWLVTLGLKRNRAAVRYWLWFAASVKFLVPFSFLIALGSRLSWQPAPPIAQPQWAFVDSAFQPFAASTAANQVVSPHASSTLTPILVAIWLCGVSVGIAFWLKCWMQMRRIRRNATPLPLGLPIPVLSSASQIEPGVFEIFCPVLLLPEGIGSRLTSAQLEAVVAHEVSHVHRRDNLTAAVHMVVEILFWFFPVVWWLRVRLIEEREHACDEAVLRMGSEAESYAEGIIEVCKSYTESPAACISGISGSDLKKRIIRIVNRRLGENLTRRKKVTLALACVTVLIAPLAIGLLNAAPLHAQTLNSAAVWEKAAGGKMSFEVASVKRDTSAEHHPANFSLDANEASVPPGGALRASFQLITFIQFAYKLQLTPVQVSAILANQPQWFTADWFDIEAHGPANATKDQMRLMLQALLADRFKLSVHFETRQQPVFALVLEKHGKLGPQLIPHSQGPACDSAVPQANNSATPGPSAAAIFPATCNAFVAHVESGSYIQVGARNTTMERLAATLGTLPGESTINRVIIDNTGLPGTFDVMLKYTPDAPLSLNGGAMQFDGSQPTLFSALKEQLGLKLEARTGPVQTLVIDHIEEPTPN